MLFKSENSVKISWFDAKTGAIRLKSKELPALFCHLSCINHPASNVWPVWTESFAASLHNILVAVSDPNLRHQPGPFTETQEHTLMRMNCNIMWCNQIFHTDICLNSTTWAPLHTNRPPGSSLCGCRPRLTEPAGPDPHTLSGPGQRANSARRYPWEAKVWEKSKTDKVNQNCLFASHSVWFYFHFLFNVWWKSWQPRDLFLFVYYFFICLFDCLDCSKRFNIFTRPWDWHRLAFPILMSLNKLKVSVIQEVRCLDVQKLLETWEKLGKSDFKTMFWWCN